jgi:hypothetical protein
VAVRKIQSTQIESVPQSWGDSSCGGNLPLGWILRRGGPQPGLWVLFIHVIVACYSLSEDSFGTSQQEGLPPAGLPWDWIASRGEGQHPTGVGGDSSLGGSSGRESSPAGTPMEIVYRSVVSSVRPSGGSSSHRRGGVLPRWVSPICLMEVKVQF